MKRINAGYYIKEALKNVFVNGFMGFASICILMSCLVIIGLFLLMSRNVELNLKNLEDQNEIVAFVDEALSLEDAKK
jgi:cell division transport system permease protein